MVFLIVLEMVRTPTVTAFPTSSISSFSSSLILKRIHTVTVPSPPSSLYYYNNYKHNGLGMSSSSLSMKQAQPKKKGSSKAAASVAQQRQSIQRFMEALNLYKKLPWNVQREQERRARQLRRETAALYRELGIPEDATFEEINEATDNLKRLYRDDLKKQIKIDVWKDKIMQLRLEQRMGGLMSVSSEARQDTTLSRKAAEYRRKKLFQLPSAPQWTRGLIVKPNETWRKTCVTMYGSMAVAGFILPSLANSLSLFAFVMGTGLMGSRGARDEFNPNARGMRGARSELGWHNFYAAIFAMLVFLFTLGTATFFTSRSSLAGNPIEKPLINVACQGTMFVASLYFKFYKGDRSAISDEDAE